MVIEQTKNYQKRMVYDPVTHTFSESLYDSLLYARNISLPYGWIKESGTPPKPHRDVILMSYDDYELGDVVVINIIGVFLRQDGDYKYVAVKANSVIDDLFDLPQSEIEELKRLYPDIDQDEGWYGKIIAEKCLNTCKKAL